LTVSRSKIDALSLIGKAEGALALPHLEHSPPPVRIAKRPCANSRYSHRPCACIIKLLISYCLIVLLPCCLHAPLSCLHSRLAVVVLAATYPTFYIGNRTRSGIRIIYVCSDMLLASVLPTSRLYSLASLSRSVIPLLCPLLFGH
jgi:hypothetical protein